MKRETCVLFTWATVATAFWATSCNDNTGAGPGTQTADAGERDGSTGATPDAGADAGAQDATVDAVSAPDSSIDASDAAVGTDAGGQTDAHADATDGAILCAAPCTVGTTQCSSSGPQSCVLKDGGCPSWVQTATCGPHEGCVTEATGAVCSCIASPLCTDAGAVCDPTSNQIDICNIDSNGCLYVNPGARCLTDAGGAASSCSAAECVVGCIDGYHACPSGCADNTSPASCGSSCSPCGAPSNAMGTCDAGVCGYVCNVGYGYDGGGCSALPPPPRLIAPLSTKIATTSTPVLSWEFTDGLTRAHVDICRDRACSQITWSTDTTGTSANPPTALPPGAAFWRVFGLVNGQRTMPSPTWQLHVPALSAPPWRSSWGTVHDFNGDGFADVLGPNSGGATVYYGGPSGPVAGDASVAFGGSDVYSAASAGDINGDGFADLVVSSFGTPSTVSVYLGSAAGPSTTPSQVITASSVLLLVPVGDVNADGYADLATTGAVAGTIDVYFGSPFGLPSTPSVTISATSPPSGFMATVGLSAPEPAQPFGGGGDINGDGYDDIVAGDGAFAGGAGRLYVFFGGDAGPAKLPSQVIASPSSANIEFGAIAVIAGDLNGDGYADVGLGAPEGWGTAAGASRNAYVFYGGPDGLPATPSATLPSPSGSTLFNTGVAAGGDLNGDGYCDFIVGDPSYQNPDYEVGAAFLFMGGPSGLSSSPTITVGTPPTVSLVGGSGRPVAGVGDVNGDGICDLASVCWGPTATGCAASIYLGNNTGVWTTPVASLPVAVNVVNWPTWWSSL